MYSKRLIIFDLDGTLLNTIADLAAACNHALRACGYREHPVDSYPQMVGNGIYKLMMRALRAQGIEADELGPEVMAMTPYFKAYYGEHYADHSSPYPGIVELLAAISERSETGGGEIMLAIASNKYQAATELIARKFFSDTRWLAIRGQRDDFPKKPDPAVVFEIMKTAGITRPEQVLYVGDSGVDMETARRAGVESVGVTWGFVEERVLADYHPDHIVHEAQEILQYI